MAEIIQVLGPVGHGKTTSLRGINPKETYFINCLGKRLPFLGGNKFETDISKTGRKGHYCVTSRFRAILAIMENVNKRKDIKNLIIDDFSYVMVQTFVDGRNDKDGWTRFNRIGNYMWDIFRGGAQLREDLRIIILAHLGADDQNIEKGEQLGMKTVGRFVRTKVTPEGFSTIILVPNIHRRGKEATFVYLTQADKLNPSRSPIGMFPYEIPCDMQLVLDRLQEYEDGIPLEESKLNFDTK